MKVSAQYAAGFFDGEGSISLVAKNVAGRATASWMLCVTVAQMNPEPLFALRDTWGGNVRGPRRHGQYEWRANTAQAADFLRAIQPYVIVKADVVALALEFRDGVMQRWGGRHSLPQAEVDRRHRIRRDIMACNRRYSRVQRVTDLDLVLADG
jgi:hypothetical protein